MDLLVAAERLGAANPGERCHYGNVDAKRLLVLLAICWETLVS